MIKGDPKTVLHNVRCFTRHVATWFHWQTYPPAVPTEDAANHETKVHEYLADINAAFGYKTTPIERHAMTTHDPQSTMDQRVIQRMAETVLVDEIKRRAMMSVILARATDEDILSEALDRDMVTAGLLTDIDDHALLKQVTRRNLDLPADEVINASEFDEFLNLLAHGAAREAYDFLRSISNNAEPLEARMRRVAQYGTPAQLL